MSSSTLENYKVNVETYGEGERKVIALNWTPGSSYPYVY
jgi:hypothetical protein